MTVPRSFAWIALVATLVVGPGVARPVQAIDFRWIGQDGHDSVGGHPGPAKNEYQDIHLVVKGVPPRRKVVHVLIRGHGSGEWTSDTPQGKYVVDIVRKPNSGTVDLYIEPFMTEVGREFEIHLKYDNGEEVVSYTQGGKADPNLRVKGRGLDVRWEGPDGSDRVGLTSSVGPDGLEDVRISFAGLPASGKISAITIQGPDKLAWSSGINPQGHRNAEFERKPSEPTQGLLAIGVDQNLAGKTLKALITYEDGHTDSKTFPGGSGFPARAMPPVTVADVPRGSLSARWLGQDGTQFAPGDVHVSVTGLAPGRRIVAAAMGDGVVGRWTSHEPAHPGFEMPGGSSRLSLVQPGPGSVDLAFPPCRDETGATMTLRVRDDQSREEIVTFPGGACDLAKLAPPLPSGSATAKPGDDLQALVSRHGTVTLAPGTFILTKPLVLTNPVRLLGSPGSILRFRQAPGDSAWTTAIKIHQGGTTLEGFSVRFAGPIRWDREVSFGPALIGTTDNRDPAMPVELRHEIKLARLDLEAPPAPSDQWGPSVHLVRFNNASSGRIEGNTLRGGSIVFAGGPWSITDNVYRGAMPHNFVYDLFGASYTHDVLIARNRTRIEKPSGKTWRFLVLTQRGAHDVIADNVVEGIGAREDDPIPHPNAPEVVLTEAYRLHFEGKPAAISPDGRVVVIPTPQGDPAISTGDVLSILAGPQAGQWRTVVLPLGPRTFLLDEPIAAGTEAISLSTGFTHETFKGNTVDTRGSGQAANLVLAGNMFGARVENNHFKGGAESVRLIASASEAPNDWGWSHAPLLGAVVQSNILEDAGTGGIGVEHSKHTKASQGRVYLSVDLIDNVVKKSSASPQPKAAAAKRGPMLRVGWGPGRDPGEMLVQERGTRVEGLSAEEAVFAHALVNGKLIHDAPLSGAGTRKDDPRPTKLRTGPRPPGPKD